MKRRVVSLVVLFLWLASGLGLPVTTEVTAAPAVAEGLVASGSVVSEASAYRHLLSSTADLHEVSLDVPANAQSLSSDRDYDGLADDVEESGWENVAGFFVTDPFDADSDDDGLTDGGEKLFDTNPLDDTSPGIYVEYSDDLKTRKYFSWERHGDKFIALDSVVVRRGSAFYVGGPADATIRVDKSRSSLTTLTPHRDVCTGRWRISVPADSRVGKYTVVLERGAWSESLKLYVIFGWPTSMSDADAAAYLYSDDPDSFRDEYAMWFMTTYDMDYSWAPWPPYHQTKGSGFAFQTDHYKAYVFEEHVIDVINGYSNPWDAVNALGHHLDEILRFEARSVGLNMWATLHAYNHQAQCSTHASALTSLIRGAGVGARPVVCDWDMYMHGALFDHSTEVWLYGRWRVMRAFRRNESLPGEPIDGGIYTLRERSSWFYTDSGADILVVANPGWAWEQTQTDWGGSGQTDYVFGNYNIRRIIRWDWVETEVTQYNGWGWGREPTDVGDPYQNSLGWPSSVPTPAVIVQVEGNGSVTKVPNQSSYDYGDVVRLEAFPAVGWFFGGWSGDLEGTDNPDTVTVTDDDDMRITATFTPNEYTLHISVDGEGSVTRAPNQSTYHYGDVVQLTAVPSPGWSFDHWSGALSGSANPQNVTITGDTSVTAHFTRAEYTLTWTEDPDGSGYVTKSPDKTTYRYGDVVTLHANAASGWTFHHWSGDLSGSDNPDNVTITGNTSVTAHFVEGGGGDESSVAVASAPVSVSTATPDLPVGSGEVPDGAVQLGQVVADYGVDLDGDGRFDQLVIEVEVIAAQPGYYSIGGLVDSPEFTAYAGIPAFSSAATYTYLEAGSQTVQLAFDGSSIALARVDGPYEVKGLWVSDLELDADLIDLSANTLDRKDPAYVTAAYRAGDFETLGATFTGQYGERGVDSDRDGRLESLTIDAGLELSTPGTYTVVGELQNSEGQIVSQATWTGSHSPASLQFDGIRGTVGPYTLKNLYLLNADDEIVDSVTQAYTTQQVIEVEGKTRIARQDDRVELGLQSVLTGTYSDSGLDLDGDGLYDFLKIDVQVEVEEAGEHRLEGWLEGEDGRLISWASSDPVSLTLGTHSLSLPFSGPAISAHNVDGPLTLMALKLLAGDGYEVLDEVDVAYTTAAYASEQFESLPYVEPAEDRVLLFEDHMENGGDSWTPTLPWTLITAQYHSPIHAWTDSPDGSYANNRDVSLTIAEPVTLSGFGRPVLQFQACYDLETDYDFGYVEISTDDGVTWTDVATYTGRTVHWTGEMVDLGAIGDAETLWARFRLHTDGGVTADGIYIDTVAIYLDSDLDDDGISNDVEVGDDPANPADTDGDGTPDYLDEDSDGDGIPDEVEAGRDPANPVDTDGDGAPDYVDEDSDGDGIPDEVEAGEDPANPADTDGDGTPDYVDEDSDGDGIPDEVEAGDDPANPVDTDGDGTPDYVDDDSDGDGIPDEVEAGEDPTGPVDTDGDGTPDYLDDDSDGDGIPDEIEAGDDPANPVDTDGDGTPDYLDDDSDGDGIPDEVEAGDDPTNPADTDGDGTPDYLDDDSDDDGLDDSDEVDEGTDPLDPDSDDDGVPDGTDPQPTVFNYFYYFPVAFHG
jgi:uncharacterized repeat protein (TIGR02543 family)